MMGSQCVSSDGRGCRCARQVIVGRTMCEHHYRQLKHRIARGRRRWNANTSSYFEDGNKKNSLVAKEKKGMIIRDRRPKNCCANYSNDVSEKDCVKEKEIAVEKTVNICLDYHDAVPKDGEKDKGNRNAKMCVRSNETHERGRGCRQQALVGNDSCEFHLRLKNMIMANKRKDKNVGDHVYDSQCRLEGEGNETEKQVNAYSMCDDHACKGSISSSHKKLVDINHFTDVVEKDRANIELSCVDERISKASQCRRTDGKGWRCRQQALVGYNMCEHHLRLKSTRMVKVKYKNDVVEKDLANSKVSSGAERITQDSQCTDTDGKQGRCRQQALVGYNLCENHLVQDQNSRSKNVDATSDSEDENEKAQLVAVKRKWSEIVDITEDSRCRRTDGKEWRCRKQALVGYKLCEYHLVQGRNSRSKNVDSTSNSEDENEKGQLVVVKRKGSEIADITEASRCRRTDGKRWRCRKQALVGYNMCDHHLRLKGIRIIKVNFLNDVIEKDLANSKVSSEAERITQDSQCTHMDGKRWRCRQQALVGYNLCEHHLVQDQNSRSKNVDATSDSEDENEKGQLVAVKTKGSENADITEDSRCKCTDGMGWRCSQQARAGYNFCEHHFGKRRLC